MSPIPLLLSPLWPKFHFKWKFRRRRWVIPSWTPLLKCVLTLFPKCGWIIIDETPQSIRGFHRCFYISPLVFYGDLDIAMKICFLEYWTFSWKPWFISSSLCLIALPWIPISILCMQRSIILTIFLNMWLFLLFLCEHEYRTVNPYFFFC